MREHIRAGGRACALEAGVNGQMIALYDRGGHIPLVWTHLIPATLEGRATHNVQNAMFAAAMAFSLGIKLDAIRQGLRTFDSTFFQAPGRMNVFNEHPFKVLFDYGHNAHAVAAMADLAQRLDVAGRRIVVLAGPGDRRDEDLVAIAQAVAGRFDHYICRRDDNLRDGRPMRCRASRPRRCVRPACRSRRSRSFPDEQEAIAAALAHGGSPGTCCWYSPTRWCAPGSRSPSSSRPGAGGRSSGAGDAALDGEGTRAQRRIASAARPSAALSGAHAGERAAPTFSLEGLIRDERGVRLAPEAED